jgi:nitrogen regulatory protein P-II 1
MKEIKAFIKPNRVEKVVEALKKTGYKSVTLSKGEGTGAYKHKDASPSLDFHFTDSPVVKLELVCQNEDTDKVVRLICANAQTPERGDGIIYVTDIQKAFRIKTCEPFEK